MLWLLDKKQFVRMLGRIKKRDYCIVCVRAWAPVCYVLAFVKYGKPTRVLVYLCDAHIYVIQKMWDSFCSP